MRLSKIKKTFLFIFLLSQIVCYNVHSQKWKTMTSRGDKIAYNSSNIYQNPPMFVFLRKGSRTPIPTITVAAKGWFSGISIIYCDFDDGRLSIKRATNNDNDVVPYLKVTGDGYEFFKLVGDNGPIISNLKKGKTVKLSIEDNAYKSSKSIEAEKNISLRGSTSAINYALGIKTKPSTTYSISDNYYWVELLESQNLRKVYDFQFVSFFMSNYSNIKKIRVFDNSKTGKYSSKPSHRVDLLSEYTPQRNSLFLLYFNNRSTP